MLPAPPAYRNQNADAWTFQPAPVDRGILSFHQSLPSYAATPLVCCNDLAKALGVRMVYVKDESERFGLPSFKILGASWAIYRAVCTKLGHTPDISLLELSKIASGSSISLVTCSDGNWGRSVARMAKYLTIPATVYVPANIDKATQDKIVGEGARCLVSPGDYDASIRAAKKLADQTEGALLVMDTSWVDYTEVPQVRSMEQQNGAQC